MQTTMTPPLNKLFPGLNILDIVGYEAEPKRDCDYNADHEKSIPPYSPSFSQNIFDFSGMLDLPCLTWHLCPN
jgi:hypothetical protein